MLTRMETVRVNLAERSYDIAMATKADSLADFAKKCLPNLQTAIIIADEKVSHWADEISRKLTGIKLSTAIVPSGESSKSIQQTDSLYTQLAKIKADRQTVVFAVGGGVIGDLAGFVAATYNRGLPLFMIPTTLLSMVDSSVGGKVGINIPAGKNLVGSFHQPTGVWIDPQYLTSLPEREYLSGLAEVVKYGVIMDAPFFEKIERDAEALLNRETEAVRQIVSRCCRLKADVVEQDERETKGLRAILNYGHTFGHAFETVGGYGSWLHGEAVAAGMVCASRLAELHGLIDSDLTKRQTALLKKFKLPISSKREWNADELIDVMKRDKKAKAGELRFILPTRLGHVKLFDDVKESDVCKVLEVLA
jgi:3-dehydroquinate synthase